MSPLGLKPLDEKSSPAKPSARCHSLAGTEPPRRIHMLSPDKGSHSADRLDLSRRAAVVQIGWERPSLPRTAPGCC